jgi:hypothetical protein
MVSCDPEAMVGFLLGKEPGVWRQVLGWFKAKRSEETDSQRPHPSPRKLRLFACACIRPLFELLKDPRSEHAIEVSERFADGQATAQELEEARNDAWLAVESLQPSAIELASPGFALGPATARVWPRAARAAAEVALPEAGQAVVAVQAAVEHASIEWAASGNVAEIAARAGAATRADLLRDIFGPLPFRSFLAEPPRLTATVTNLVRAMYDQPDLPSGHLDAARIAVLADALEEAGCTDQEVLEHCRTPGNHVRGCWVVDLLLGRA